MNFDDAVRILGPDGVLQAEEIAASLPPLTEQQVEALAQILHSAAVARRATPEPASENASDSDAA